MGKRLNIELIVEGKTIANVYYHWRAYTSTSLQLVQQIIEIIHTLPKVNSVIQAVHLLESTGARLTRFEIRSLKKIHAQEWFEEAADAMDGLISVTAHGIEETRKWEEKRIEVHLDKEYVQFDVFWCYAKDAYMQVENMTEEAYEQLPINTTDFYAIPFATFSETTKGIEQLLAQGKYAMRMENGDILRFIE